MNAEENREKLKQLLRENPDLKKAFLETLDDMRKPENVQRMSDEITRGICFIQEHKDKTPKEVLEILRTRGVPK